MTRLEYHRTFHEFRKYSPKFMNVLILLNDRPVSENIHWMFELNFDIIELEMNFHRNSINISTNIKRIFLGTFNIWWQLAERSLNIHENRQILIKFVDDILIESLLNDRGSIYASIIKILLFGIYKTLQGFFFCLKVINGCRFWFKSHSWIKATNL